MTHFDYEYYDEPAALDDYSGGCLPFAALPPLAVIVTGVIMYFFLTSFEFFSLEAAVQENISIQELNDEQGAPVSIGNTQSSKQIAALFTPEVQRWEAEIVEWSNEWGLDPNLVATVMQIESCGDPRAVSGAGAMGLFQVMPFHFDGIEDPYRPGTNAYRGLAYLRSALDARGGDVRLAFAGYNGGITGAKRPESAWPAETIRYVYWGTGIYADAKSGHSQSERLNEWLGRGGASLCTQAASR
jgi:soluble lytic murein transglycosylase-like protein